MARPVEEINAELQALIDRLQELAAELAETLDGADLPCEVITLTEEDFEPDEAVEMLLDLLSADTDTAH